MPRNRTIKLAERLAFIITRLISERHISVSELARISGCHQRTILRDIDRLMEPGVNGKPALVIDKIGPDVYSLSEENYKSFITMDKVLEFASILSWRSFLPEMDLNLILNDDLKETVRFFNAPIEDIGKNRDRRKTVLQLNHSTFNRNVDHKPRKGRISNDIKENRNNITTFTRLVEYCKTGRVIEIEYLKRGAENPGVYQVEPYQLVNYKGIWYLMAMHDGIVKSFTFVKILKITPLSRSFEKNLEILERIRTQGTISEDSAERVKSATLRVTGFGVDYFERIDNILPNIASKTRVDENTLDIHCVNLHPNDVLQVVGQWLPWVTIVEPKELADLFKSRVDEWRVTQRSVERRTNGESTDDPAKDES